MKFLSLVAGLFASATTAAADVRVTFSEGAPTDRFTFEATDGCISGPARLEIDLSGSSAGLIFDVTGAGAGVEVYQPFTLVSGDVTARSDVADGDTQLTLEIGALTPDSPIAFTIDLDDTIGQREITVSGAEITGALARLVVDGITTTAAFGPDAVATIETADCIS